MPDRQCVSVCVCAFGFSFLLLFEFTAYRNVGRTGRTKCRQTSNAFFFLLLRLFVFSFFSNSFCAESFIPLKCLDTLYVCPPGNLAIDAAVSFPFMFSSSISFDDWIELNFWREIKDKYTHSHTHDAKFKKYSERIFSHKRSLSTRQWKTNWNLLYCRFCCCFCCYFFYCHFLQ